MKPHLFRTLAASALVAGLPSLNWSSSALGCGLDWALPRNHFEGVTNQGNVSWWEKIGEVDCGDGLVLPLHINFNSQRDGGAPSPYLGEGWMLALLESKFVQEGEDRFNMVQPDGLNNLFLRATAGGKDSVLNGSSGWKGEIKGGTITAWASCGWKLVFEQGHITSMTSDKGRKLDWVYEGGKVSELREGNATRLKVEYGADGRAQALALPGGGERIFIAQDRKPRVQTITGQNVITGADESLSRLTLADGREQAFTFGTNEKMLPTLEVGEIEGDRETGESKRVMAPRRLSWDPRSKLAIQDGEWLYEIRPAMGDDKSAAIRRKTATGLAEYWHQKHAGEEEEQQDSEGLFRTEHYFVAGPMAGRLRASELSQITPNGTKRQLSSEKFAYNEHGQLIRSVSFRANGTATTVVRSPDGKFSCVTVFSNGTKFTRNCDAQGNLLDQSVDRNRIFN